MSNQEIFADPAWKAQRASSDNSVVITPCEPIEMRLLDVRIPLEPTSYVEESDRKNVSLELRDDRVRAFLKAQENALEEEWGFVNSCLARPGLAKCKINPKRVHIFDKDRNAIAAPKAWSEWVVNDIVKLMGNWQTPDGGGSGLSLQATDIQLLAPYKQPCPF